MPCFILKMVNLFLFMISLKETTKTNFNDEILNINSFIFLGRKNKKKRRELDCA